MAVRTDAFSLTLHFWNCVNLVRMGDGISHYPEACHGVSDKLNLGEYHKGDNERYQSVSQNRVPFRQESIPAPIISTENRCRLNSWAMLYGVNSLSIFRLLLRLYSKAYHTRRSSRPVR